MEVNHLGAFFTAVDLGFGGAEFYKVLERVMAPDLNCVQA
jgi:hypothetical protein